MPTVIVHTALISSGALGYRKKMNVGHMFTTQTHIPDYITSKSSASIFTKDGAMSGETIAIYANLAKSLQTEEYNNVKKNWETYKALAGTN